MIYGIHPVQEALNSTAVIDRVFVEKGKAGLDAIKQQCQEANIPVMIVPSFKLDRLTRKNHQGVVALISPVEFADLEEIVSAAFEKGETPMVLVLDGVTDVRNFGAIARTAECVGVHALVIPERNAAPINEDAIKTSSGALMRLPICRERSLRRAMESLQQFGLRIVAITEKGNDTLYDVNLEEPVAFIMGAEDTGISNELIRISDHLAAIPMQGVTSSLNVSVACGVALYEAVRQRRAVK
ncbi:MAG: 23S rRNA (guanosine(2251)-2'-O)-methyltransferase RlmB [Bacteroidota bacterium]|nr:23S rRNA (guanosine(2251)-2'-O)-methyltransferase RlmB [Bacteroidota bacterium]MDX5430829.1 23S rRNA (guanosine(2251)-2'-O)-methyltransferase RlmB [Bacteroidota bacterium]MDX5469573.1 23S rRNA (guanosine(2251)-2'-O)-methyltransferase RlmB [Bacteroidota bacterium]